VSEQYTALIYFNICTFSLYYLYNEPTIVQLINSSLHCSILSPVSPILHSHTYIT